MKKRFILVAIMIPVILATACGRQAENNIHGKKTSCKAAKPECVAYLMAHFGPKEKLYYAYSKDARNWTALNEGKPVFEPDARLRDPFVNRAQGKFHLVHTKGWDHPTIFHWESTDLIHWEGGPIDVVDPSKKRAWAPEFFYSESEDLFYVFWASIYNDHNSMHYLTTRDWKNITPVDSAVYYDIGMHDIDLTMVESNGIYYNFHKPGAHKDMLGIRLSTSTSLDPAVDSFADDGVGKAPFEDDKSDIMIEGPEVVKLIGEDKWYLYGDRSGYKNPLEAWETTDFETFTKISVSTPPKSRHCSFVQITQAELDKLLEAYPVAK